MKAQATFLGALAAAAVVIAVIAITGFNAVAFAVFMTLVIGGYLWGRFAADSSTADAARGVLVGMNCGLNLTLWYVIGGALFGSNGAGAGLGVAVAALSFISVWPSISTSEVYQGFLGWANWLMPMSWLVIGSGVVLYLVSCLGHLILYLGPKWTPFQIQSLHADWKTGTWFMQGGWVSNCNPLHTAFNMGAFSFVDWASTELHMDHEAGHTLNLGAFGFVFHFVGALDENVIGGRAEAYSERLAESNVPGTSVADIIPMWT